MKPTLAGLQIRLRCRRCLVSEEVDFGSDRISTLNKGGRHHLKFILLPLVWIYDQAETIDMVSLLSFFTGKKKSLRLPPSPTNPTNGALTSSPSTGQTPPRHRQPRFLSLRHRKSSKDRPVAPTPRRASTEAARKSSPKAKSPGSELPRLALGWESTDDGTVGRSSLGLEGVGRPPRLAENERKLLDRYGYGYDGVMQGWKWFGKALRDTGRSWLKGGLYLMKSDFRSRHPWYNVIRSQAR